MVPYHIDFKLFDTHEEKNHNGILEMTLYAHHGIRKGDYVCEIPLNKEDSSLGWKDVLRYQIETFLRKDVCGMMISNSPDTEFWYVYFDIHGVAQPVTFIFESRIEAEDIFDKLVKWWLHGEVV